MADQVPTAASAPVAPATLASVRRDSAIVRLAGKEQNVIKKRTAQASMTVMERTTVPVIRQTNVFVLMDLQVSCEALHYCSHHGSCVAYDVCICTTGWKVFVRKRGTTKRFLSFDRADLTEFGLIFKSSLIYKGASSCKHLKRARRVASLTVPVLVNAPAMANASNQTHVGAMTAVRGTTAPSPYSAPSYRTVMAMACVYSTGLTLAAGHGSCVSFDQCLCEAGWSSADCSVADCSAVADCSSQGVCVFPNQCECFDGYQGANCSNVMSANEHAPVFNPSFYSATVSERSEVPRGEETLPWSGPSPENLCLTGLSTSRLWRLTEELHSSLHPPRSSSM